MDENAKQSRENLLANCHVVLGERNALKEKKRQYLGPYKCGFRRCDDCGIKQIKVVANM